MTGRRWKVANAKAQFSKLIRQAVHEPQIVENHGTPTGVVLSVEAFDKLSKQAEEADNGVARFLQSAQIARHAGGATLLIKRRNRKNPLKSSDL